MAALGSRNSFRFSTVILNVAALALFAGCWLEKGTIVVDYISNIVSIQATVKNSTSGDLFVSLLPTIGSRKNSAYQWAIDTATDSPEPPVSLAANSEQVLLIRVGERTYENFQVGDKILSFLLQIDGDEYAGWDAQYGTGGRTLVDQGYGYAVLGDGGYARVKWNSPLPAGKEYGDPAGSFGKATVRYAISITGSGVEFILDEVVYYPSGEDSLEHDDPGGG